MNSKFGLCCFCVELRLGVTLLCAFQFFYAMFSAVAILAHEPRLQAGGYNPRAGRVQAYFCATGLLFALIGFLGTYDTKIAHLRIFNYWQIMKLAVGFGVFVADMISLGSCEGLANTLEGQIDFSPTMFAISRKGVCSVARLSYVLGFAIDFGLNAYWTWVVHDYMVKMLSNPSFGMDVLTGMRNHLTVSYDPDVGEPSQYLGSTLQRPSDKYGDYYGAMDLSRGPKFGAGA